MSWLIEEYIKQIPYIKERGNIDSDEYNNALIIELTIEKMMKQNLISDFEKDVLWAISVGYNYSEAARLLDSHRLTISDTINDITDRIAYILGGEFTDSAFMDRIQNIEDISEQDVDALFRRRLIKADNV